MMYVILLLKQKMDIQKTSEVFQQLFNKDIIQIILQYTDNNIIIQLQDYFPNSLKYITINKKELELINKNNYQYIRKLNCSNSKNITDKDIQHLVQLTKLYCWNCPNITDNSIQHLVQLTILYCWDCPNITDKGIQHLVQLTELDCGSCPNITDNGIKHFVRLTELYCGNCPKITDNGIQHLVQLTKLDCGYCPNVTTKYYYIAKAI